MPTGAKARGNARSPVSLMLAVALSLAALSLVACGGEDSASAPSASPTASDTTAGKMVTVTNDRFRYSLVYPSDLLEDYPKGAETTKARWGADHALFLCPPSELAEGDIIAPCVVMTVELTEPPALLLHGTKSQMARAARKLAEIYAESPAGIKDSGVVEIGGLPGVWARVKKRQHIYDYYQLYREDAIFGFITTCEQTGDGAETARRLREVVRSFRSL